MHVLVIGGSGLLGTFTVREALSRGFTVSALARRPRSDPQVHWHSGDVATLSADALGALLHGVDGVVYALGKDERDPPRVPAKAAFFDDLVGVCGKVARAAKAAGVKRFVAHGSYFTTLADTTPAWRMEQHDYVSARLAQREHLLALSDGAFRAYVLALPYILGALPDNVPPWTPIFSMLTSPVPVFFPTGGTATCTARQVAQASIGAIVGDAPAGAYAIAGANWSWDEWATRFFRARGMPAPRLRSFPRGAFVAVGLVTAAALRLTGRQGGLDVKRFVDVQYGDAFVDVDAAMAALGFGHDDYDAALKETVDAWAAQR